MSIGVPDGWSSAPLHHRALILHVDIRIARVWEIVETQRHDSWEILVMTMTTWIGSDNDPHMLIFILLSTCVVVLPTCQHACLWWTFCRSLWWFVGRTDCIFFLIICDHKSVLNNTESVKTFSNVFIYTNIFEVYFYFIPPTCQWDAGPDALYVID